MNLAHLSLVRVRPGRRVPSPPTPEERLRAFRSLRPVESEDFGNARFAQRYAAEQTPLSALEMQRGFNFKYGT